MVMRTGQNIQAQKMGRQATGEGSLMLRLFETSIPGWLPLRAGNAIQHIPREIKMVPCRGFLARAGHAGSTIDLQIANMHQTPQLMVMRGLAHWGDDMRNDLVLDKD